MSAKLRQSILWAGFMIGCSFLFSCCSPPKADKANKADKADKAGKTSKATAVLTEQELRRLLLPVKGWDQFDGQGYSSNDWENLVIAAKAIQDSSPNSVERAMWLYQLDGHPTNEFSAFFPPDFDTKLFLLMRVIFDLPDSIRGRIIMYGAWEIGPGIYNSDGSLNQSWPIKWDNSHPKIIYRFAGIEGINGRYNASREFAEFLTNYPMRDLSSFRGD